MLSAHWTPAWGRGWEGGEWAWWHALKFGVCVCVYMRAYYVQPEDCNHSQLLCRIRRADEFPSHEDDYCSFVGLFNFAYFNFYSILYKIADTLVGFELRRNFSLSLLLLGRISYH